MKKYKLWLAALAVVSMVAASGCSLLSKTEAPAESTTTIAQSQELTLDEKADKIVASMKDYEKVGQLVMIGVHGTTINDDMKNMLSEYQFGGIVLFDRNMESKEQAQKLLADLKSYGKNNEKVPLFLAVDQEGGAVARMEDKLIKVPPAADLGKEDVSVATDYAKKAGTELKDLGFNLNFAPVVDLGLTYGRSYSPNDPTKVVTYASSVAKAYEDDGLMFSFKHFPGIGKADVDLHKEENTISASKETLLAEDVKPYSELIPQFDSRKYMIMVSHAKYPAFDGENPASLSRPIMHDLLREQLKFDGVIITDDMEMGAVANHYTFADMAVKTIQAGADIILVCHEYPHMLESYNAILKAVRAGTISEEQLNASVKRIVKMKLSNSNLMN